MDVSPGPVVILFFALVMMLVCAVVLTLDNEREHRESVAGNVVSLIIISLLVLFSCEMLMKI